MGDHLHSVHHLGFPHLHHFGYASVSESTPTLVDSSGNPEPITEKTLKNSREFFARRDGPALAQPMRQGGAGSETS